MCWWPCVTVFRHVETNVNTFFFSLLRIKGLYMFRALLAHPQEAQHKQHLVYCVRVMSVGCNSFTPILVQPTDITHTQYTKCRLYIASWGWVRNARNMSRPLIIGKLNKKWWSWCQYVDGGNHISTFPDNQSVFKQYFPLKMGPIWVFRNVGTEIT
jgi:hypothetical protein